MFFKKRPVIIEAVQLRWDTRGEVCDFVGVGEFSKGKPEGCFIDKNGQPTQDCTEEIGLRIPTLEGIMLARQNDWIIKGVKGEFYSCKPDIFEMTYEAVEEVVNVN